MDSIKLLILKYLREEITPNEQLELDSWLAESNDNIALFEEMNDPVRVGEALAKMDSMHEGQVWERLQVYSAIHRKEDAKGTLVHRVHFLRASRRWAAAVTLLIIGAAAAWWYMHQHPSPQVVAGQVKASDVAPGGNKAVLTLASGAQIILDSAHNGTLAQQGNATVSKTDSGKLSYNILNERPTAVLYNTLTTPRGGQYQLTLPVGTNVGLNAASSIRYPTAFAGKERQVEVTGEVYFEVVKNASKPFKVKVGDGAEVEVLGTSFDVNAYPDEALVKTTLLEGSVKVSANGSGVTLKAGQQAKIAENGKLSVTSDVDTEEAVAWKNGKFIFSGNDIGSVMRQISRWYDVDVSYQGDFQGDEFVGVISRFKNASEILRMLEQTRSVKFNIEGKKITVSPINK